MAQLSNFVQELRGGGARANQFSVKIFGRSESRGVSAPHFEFMCRSAQIPALTIGEVTVPYRGRQIFVPGDRTYDAWTVTIYNDAQYSIRNSLEIWSNELQDVGGGTWASGSHVYRTAQVMQRDRNNHPIRSYDLIDIWPTSLDAIDLAFDTNDTVEEFGATFRFNYLIINKAGQEGNRVGTGQFPSTSPPLTTGSTTSTQGMDTTETFIEYE